MSGYSTFLAEHVRLAILRVLDELSEFRSNSAFLRDAVSELGLSATHDQVRTQVAWLQEQGLVTTVEALRGVLTVTATERGLDVARGRATVPGVRRPSPKA